MRVFFCTNEEGRVRNHMPIKKYPAKEYPVLSLSRRASLTVEAAFVLPVFLFAMLVFLYFMRILQGYEEIEEGLAVTARMASQKGILEKSCFYDYLEENNSSFSYIQGGKKGISMKGSYLIPGTEKILVRAEYRVLLPLPFFNGYGILIRQEVKSRVFSGVDFWRKGTGKEGGCVYVSKYGSVYHQSRSCSYLNPSVHMVSDTEVFQKRNRSGSKYKPCSVCMRKGETLEHMLYITEDGEYFHSTPGCSGLNRTVYKVLLSEIIGYGACNKCGGE